ncbi:hypothetical protein D3C71_1658450 [compost metagenome]
MSLRRQIVMHSATPGVLLQDTVPGNRAKHLGGGIGFAVVVTERYPHVSHGDTFVPSLGDRCRGAGNHFAAAHLLAQRSFTTGTVGVDQIVLHVQHQINAFHCLFPLA